MYEAVCEPDAEPEKDDDTEGVTPGVRVMEPVAAAVRLAESVPVPEALGVPVLEGLDVPV